MTLSHPAAAINIHSRCLSRSFRRAYTDRGIDDVARRQLAPILGARAPFNLDAIFDQFARLRIRSMS